MSSKNRYGAGEEKTPDCAAWICSPTAALAWIEKLWEAHSLALPRYPFDPRRMQQDLIDAWVVNRRFL